jgi:hypothetical protein
LPQIKLCLLNKQGFLKRGQRYGLKPWKDNQSTSMKYVFIYFKDKKTMFIKQIRPPKERPKIWIEAIKGKLISL